MSKRRSILCDEERLKICTAAGERLHNIASEGKTIRQLSFSDKLEPLGTLLRISVPGSFYEKKLLQSVFHSHLRECEHVCNTRMQFFLFFLFFQTVA